MARIVDRAAGLAGGDLVLRRAEGHFEIISNGVFLMDSRDGHSERELVRAAVDAVPSGRTGLRVAIAGLGVGFSARQALDDPRVRHVRVVELEPRIIDWHRGDLGAVAGRVLDDPRCQANCADIVDWLAAAQYGGERFDAVCLDVDNGPDWTVADGNGRLYQPRALAQLAAVTAPGGAVAFWSAAPAPHFATRLRERFSAVSTVEIAVSRGAPDTVYVAQT